MQFLPKVFAVMFIKFCSLRFEAEASSSATSSRWDISYCAVSARFWEPLVPSLGHIGDLLGHSGAVGIPL